MTAHQKATLALLLILVPSLSAQEKPKAYPLCRLPLVIGEIPNKPFTADLVSLSIRSDSNTANPADTGNGATGSDNGFVARDSRGRVVGRLRLPNKGDEAEEASRSWKETICDPADETVTTFQFSRVETSEGVADNLVGDDKGMGMVRQQTAKNSGTTIQLGSFHNVVSDRENLGPITFEGISAFRYRFPNTRDARSIQELVISDELAMELARKTWNNYPSSKNELRLGKIVEHEPSPAIFEVPQGVQLRTTPPPPSGSN